jgi:broad specificity phosphatase PhoE
MHRLLLIRHGTTAATGHVLYGRSAGISLNKDGREQASVTAQLLAHRYKLAEIVCSPLERARETAEIIAQRQEDLRITVDDRITEIEFGDWTGKSFEELNHLKAWQEYNRTRSLHHPPNGESMLEVQSRALRSVENVIARHSSTHDPTVAMITHGDIVRGLLLYLLGMPLDHIHRIEIATASVNSVLLGAGQPVVECMNAVFY